VPFYHDAGGLRVSSIGIGTYRGACDAATDRSYVDAIGHALRGGINLIDTSLNYRDQRSERSVGRAIGAFIEQDDGHRDEIVLCSKGGYLVPGGFAAGNIDRSQVAGGMHCLAPAFLADQIERSRRNLGIETLDVYYLHNPETQLDFVDVLTFKSRMVAAFEQLERAVAAGFIQSYGTATWNGYWESRLSLRQMIDWAREVAGNSHHFRFVQLPFNLALDDLLDRAGQDCVLDVASELGVGVVASASLWEARLAEDLPAAVGDAMAGLDTDAQRAIQFVRSTPGIAAALVGMSSAAHVTENLGVARVPNLAATAFTRLREFA
jgi:aryl-alcohol dehydrogenase-like predicted oxidoreductase